MVPEHNQLLLLRPVRIFSMAFALVLIRSVGKVQRKVGGAQALELKVFYGANGDSTWVEDANNVWTLIPWIPRDVTSAMNLSCRNQG